MGEVAERIAEFVTAYSGDLKDESLDGQRLVVAGIVVGSRTVITRARSTMAVVTLEDLQGSLEVVVFPKLFEQTGPTWQEGAILLVAGRVDHRGEEVSLLADLVMTWEDAAARGAEAFARDVAAGDRGAWRRRQAPGAPAGAAAGFGSTATPAGPAPAPSVFAPPGTAHLGPQVESGNGNGHGQGNRDGLPANLAGAPTAGRAVGADQEPRLDIPYVSPLRGGVMPAGGPLPRSSFGARPAARSGPAGSSLASVAAPVREPATPLPSIAPAEPVSTYPDEPAALTGPERDIEPALPDEARSRAATEAAAPTAPLEAAGSSSVLHVRFGGAPAARLVLAMETFRQLVRERPGETRVVVHVPAPGGSALPMELRTPVAYDSELLAEVRRRLGEGIVDLRLA